MRSAFAAAAVAFTFATASPAAPPTDVPGAFAILAPGVSLLRGAFAPGTQPDGNTVVLRGPEGLVVIDTGRHAEHTQKIIDYARAAGVPVTAVINTHWHLDHVGGNPRLRGAFPGLRVYASGAIRGAATGFLASYRNDLETAIAKASGETERAPLRAELALVDAGPALFPDETITAPGERTLAGRALHVGLEGPAATAGDVWVLDRSTGVLVAGDLVTLPAPFLDTACPEGWKGALARLSTVDFALLVPGHGPAMTRAQFAAYRTAFDGLLACAASGRAKDDCVAGWVAQAGPLVPGDQAPLARSLVGYYLDHHLRDAAGVAGLCAAAAPASPEDLREQVRHTEIAFAKTMADRDHAAFVRFLAPDTVWLGRTVLRGSEAVAVGWKRLYEGPQAPFSWEPERVEVNDSGTLAISTGPVRDPAGNRVGTYNSIWRREPDGSWRIIFDGGCPPCPCPPATPAASPKP